MKFINNNKRIINKNNKLYNSIDLILFRSDDKYKWRLKSEPPLLSHPMLFNPVALIGPHLTLDFKPFLTNPFFKTIKYLDCGVETKAAFKGTRIEYRKMLCQVYLWLY